MNPSDYVSYNIYAGGDLPPMQAHLYEYWLAGNGLFVRGERQGLSVLFPVKRPGDPYQNVHGLPALLPYVRMPYFKLPRQALLEMFDISRDVCHDGPREALFHLWYDESDGQWWRVVPLQNAGPSHVEPLETGPESSYAKALLEVHSHHTMRAFFSFTDDKEEQGFRLYGVLGEICRRPTVRLRVGLYGHFWPLPPSTVFELGDEVAEEGEGD